MLNHRKPVFWIVSLVLMFCIVGTMGCAASSSLSQGASVGETEQVQSGHLVNEDVFEGAQIQALREKYPEYFELGSFKGLEVYAWQMAEDYYQFGLMPGTNRQKTLEELMALPGATAEEMALILSTYDIDDQGIFVIPWQQVYSSYMVPEEVAKDPEYINNLRAMLGLDI